MNTTTRLYQDIGFEYRQNDKTIANHTYNLHSCYEIRYYHHGCGDVLLGNQVITVRSGTLVLMNVPLKQDVISHVNVHTSIYTKILFKPEIINMLDQAFTMIHLLGPFEKLQTYSIQLHEVQNKEMEQALHRLNHLYKQQGIVQHHRFKLAFFDLLMIIYRLCRPAIIRKTAASDKEKHVQNIINYIERHYKNEIRLEHIESHLKVSKHHLTKIFREETGLTIFEFLYQTRINQAKLLFHSNSRSTVTDVCFEVGFKNPAHFSRQFKKQVGMSPDRYRKTL